MSCPITTVRSLAIPPTVDSPLRPPIPTGRRQLHLSLADATRTKASQLKESRVPRYHHRPSLEGSATPRQESGGRSIEFRSNRVQAVDELDKGLVPPLTQFRIFLFPRRPEERGTCERSHPVPTLAWQAGLPIGGFWLRPTN